MNRSGSGILRTTTRSSDLRSPRPPSLLWRQWGSAALCLSALGLLAACVPQTKPSEFFQLTPESQVHKAAQTRYFETADDIELLSASAAVLQDIGFQVSESVHELGYLRATKERSARERGQSIGRFLVLLVSTGAIYFGVPPIRIPIDLHQKIEASMVARPVNEDATRHEVRIQFYRIVWKGDGSTGGEQILPGEQRMEMIRDPAIYQQFFAKLSKAVFLEAHTI
jgi:hypothetical protein